MIISLFSIQVPCCSWFEVVFQVQSKTNHLIIKNTVKSKEGAEGNVAIKNCTSNIKKSQHTFLCCQSIAPFKPSDSKDLRPEKTCSSFISVTCLYMQIINSFFFFLSLCLAHAPWWNYKWQPWPLLGLTLLHMFSSFLLLLLLEIFKWSGSSLLFGKAFHLWFFNASL